MSGSSLGALSDSWLQQLVVTDSWLQQLAVTMGWAAYNAQRAKQRQAVAKAAPKAALRLVLKRPVAKENRWVRFNEKRKQERVNMKRLLDAVNLQPRRRLRHKQSLRVDATKAQVTDKGTLLAWLQVHKDCLNKEPQQRAARLAQFARTRLGSHAFALIKAEDQSSASSKLQGPSSSSSDVLMAPASAA